MSQYKQRVKLANLLLESLQAFNFSRAKEIQYEKQLIIERAMEVMKGLRMFELIANKQWAEPIGKLKSRLIRDLGDLGKIINPLEQFLNGIEVNVIKFSDIWFELSQLEREFGEYTFDIENKTLSVFTEAVILDTLALGSFEIKLSIDKLPYCVNTSLPYRVIALEPNPAASDPDITHPHISHEKLCEGDGYVPIRKAIEQGRFCDFFLLVSNILKTYNPASAYVSLNSWTGIRCHNCGECVSEEYIYYCEGCEHDYCSDCTISCHACGGTICEECSFVCDECMEAVCRQCINDDGICSVCQQKRKDNNNEENTHQNIQTATASVQPYSVGQAGIHA